jgi:hypothetical protein
VDHLKRGSTVSRSKLLGHRHFQLSVTFVSPTAPSRPLRCRISIATAHPLASAWPSVRRAVRLLNQGARASEHSPRVGSSGWSLRGMRAARQADCRESYQKL